MVLLATTTISINFDMRLSPGVNFSNILRADFKHADPKSAKKDSHVVSLFLRFRDLHAQKLLLEH